MALSWASSWNSFDFWSKDIPTFLASFIANKARVCSVVNTNCAFLWAACFITSFLLSKSDITERRFILFWSWEAVKTAWRTINLLDCDWYSCPDIFPDCFSPSNCFFFSWIRSSSWIFASSFVALANNNILWRFADSTSIACFCNSAWRCRPSLVFVAFRVIAWDKVIAAFPNAWPIDVSTNFAPFANIWSWAFKNSSWLSSFAFSASISFCIFLASSCAAVNFAWSTVVISLEATLIPPTFLVDTVRVVVADASLSFASSNCLFSFSKFFWASCARCAYCNISLWVSGLRNLSLEKSLAVAVNSAILFAGSSKALVMAIPTFTDSSPSLPSGSVIVNVVSIVS